MKLESSVLIAFADFEDGEYSTRVFDLADAFAEQFQTDVMDYAKATARRDEKAKQGIFADIVQDIGGGMALSDLYGRAGVLEFAHKHGYQAGAPPKGPGNNAVLPSGDRDGRIRINDRIAKLPFLEAIENLVTRKSKVLAPLAETDPQYGVPKWKRIADMYATEHAFALARSTTQEVTDRVQDEIAKAMREGVDVNTLSERVRVVGEGMKDWSFAYANMAVRTNLKTSYVAGAFAQLRTKGVRKVVKAFEHVGIHDRAQRENHHAANGLVASVDDPIFSIFAPPMGYACRCSLRMVTQAELARRNLLDADGNVIRYEPPNFSQAHPDEGFGRNRAQAMYAGSTAEFSAANGLVWKFREGFASGVSVIEE